jgi:hypothetical protein
MSSSAAFTCDIIQAFRVNGTSQIIHSTRIDGQIPFEGKTKQLTFSYHHLVGFYLEYRLIAKAKLNKNIFQKSEKENFWRCVRCKSNL